MLYVFLSLGITLGLDVVVLLLARLVQLNIGIYAGKNLSNAVQVTRFMELAQRFSPVFFVILGILSLLVFMFLYLLFSAPTVSYLREIVNGVERIKNGDMSTQVPVRTNGELADLARAINAMQAQLKETTNKEKQAVQARDELITNVAHDLRTPLTSIIGYLELLKNKPDLPDATKQKYLRIAYDKSYRMEGLVTDLFDFTRYDKNKMEIQKSRLELKQFMEQIIDEFYPSLSSQNLECYTMFGPGKIYVDGDGELLARGFGNLMGNAIKYGADGKQIRVEAEILKNKNLARVAIVNYGKIIAPKDLEHVFDKFYRGDSARSTSGGTGLGLAIAKNVFEMHGGHIQARSDANGTVFEVLLPLAGNTNTRKEEQKS